MDKLGFSSLETGLILYLPFNNNANDESGLRHSSILSGATITRDKYGNINSAYNFVPTSKITISKSNFIEIGTNDLSISMMVKPGKTSGQNVLLSHSSSVIEQGYGITLVDGKINFYFNMAQGRISSIWQVTSLKTLEINSWYNIFAVFDRSLQNQKIYIDGVLDNSVHLSFVFQWNIFNQKDLYIGNNPEFGYSGITGVLDEIRIYNRALSYQEISEINQLNNNYFTPSNKPTTIPSFKPSFTPTAIPSFSPTLFPSKNPTEIPTIQPTLRPSAIVTEQNSSLGLTEPSSCTFVSIQMFNKINLAEDIETEFIKLELAFDGGKFLTLFEDYLQKEDKIDIQYQFYCNSFFTLRALNGVSLNNQIIDLFSLIGASSETCLIDNDLNKFISLKGQDAEYLINYQLTLKNHHSETDTECNKPTNPESKIEFRSDICKKGLLLRPPIHTDTNGDSKEDWICEYIDGTIEICYSNGGTELKCDLLAINNIGDL